MELDSGEVLQALTELGCPTLFHANTVLTSCSCLWANRLLSRNAVEEKGLPQTPQISDDQDKKLGLYDDVFLDFADLHVSFKRANKYGPVLFEFSAQHVLSSLPIGVWITKSNPVHWRSAKKQEWFRSVDEFRGSYNRFVPGPCLVLRGYGDQLPLNTSSDGDGQSCCGLLDRIRIDSPSRLCSSTVDLASFAFGAIRLAALRGSAQVQRVGPRMCASDSGCQCVGEYDDMPEIELRKRFWIPGE